MKRTKEEAEITLNNILSAGLKVFSRRGYAATTLEEIAREASVTRGAVYWHFKNKHDLYLSLLKRYESKFLEELEEIVNEEDSSINIIKRSIKKFFQTLENDDEFRMFEIITYRSGDAFDKSPEFFREQMAFMKKYHERLRKIVSKAKSETKASGLNVEAVTKILIGMVCGLENIWLMDPGAFSIAAEADELVSNFMRIFK